MLETMEPGLRRLLAPNPSPMTYRGTNGYIVGAGEVAVIDPGPDDPRHLAAWRAALEGERVSHVLITHAHRDHSALAPRLAAEFGAPLCAFGPPEAGRSALMRRLAEAGGLGGGEGVHEGFRPTQQVGHGERILSADWTLEIMHVPGHFPGHLAFAWGDVVFTGDLVMGWASTMISPPDGDLAQFYASCAGLRRRGARRLYPGHGEPVDRPAERIVELVAHRRGREADILRELARGETSVPDLVRRIYPDLPHGLRPAAARTLLAHLVHLVEAGTVEARPALGPAASFRAAERPADPSGRAAEGLL